MVLFTAHTPDSPLSQRGFSLSIVNYSAIDTALTLYHFISPYLFCAAHCTWGSKVHFVLVKRFHGTLHGINALNAA